MNPVSELNIKRHESEARALKQLRAELYVKLDQVKDQAKADEIMNQIRKTNDDITFHERKVDDLLAIA